MKRSSIIAVTTLVGMLLLSSAAGCDSKNPTTGVPSAAADGSGPVLTRSVLVSGLDYPWDLAFTPDGAMLFTEKCRGLSVRRADGSVRRLFGTGGAAVVAADLFCRGQSGMNGVAVDPDFGANRYIYVYMASNLSSPATNRVVRLKLDGGYATVGERRDIIADIPFKVRLNRWGGPGAHSGGRIRFSPYDGFLYVTTGDNHNGYLPQDLNSLGGKVLRVDREGKGAPGNNTLPGADQRIFSYGHRNVQGISFRPGDGRPFISEHGPGHSDEVTALSAGGNGGWDPKPEPGVSCMNDYCGYTSNKRDGARTPMTDLAKFPGALRPSWNNRGVSEGMSPCVFLRGRQWKGWDGRLAVGFLRGERIEILHLDSAGKTLGTATVTGLTPERIRTLVQGPDGALYVSTDGGEIWKLAPAP